MGGVLLVVVVGLFLLLSVRHSQGLSAVVVGAGPVGIAAALTLASPRHGYNVTLLEATNAGQANYDPTKAFLYNVNARGQTFTTLIPSLHRRLQERSVSSKGFADTVITVVPANPEIPIRTTKNIDKPTRDVDSLTDKRMSGTEKAVGVGYWIPRHEMVQIMLESVHEHNQQGQGGKITLLHGQECISVKPQHGSSSHEIAVISRNENSTMQHSATLVVGADGMNSKVRECLANAERETWSLECCTPDQFIPKKWTSPASFLRIKVLQLPPRFQIPDIVGKPPIVTKSDDIYALRSIHTGPRNYLSLGLLPMKNNDAVRLTNIITRPDHDLWKIKDGKTMQAWFEKAFPRMNFQQSTGIVSEEEWDRFAKAEGTRFPSCQYSHGMAVWDASGTSGMALVGDAIHAFPPDIGQGVNAGLMDVVCLDRALLGLNTVTGCQVMTAKGEKACKPTLKENLDRYQKQHACEIASLIRLARFGAPYQYKQPHRIDRILRTLWTINVAIRLMLNKLTFGLIQPSCIILSQNSNLTFRQVMRRADRTTLLLNSIVIGMIGLFYQRKLV